MPSREKALPGRAEAIPVSPLHVVLGTPVQPPWPEDLAPHLAEAVFGLGCFWGAERKFWEAPGVFTTAVGYAGGHTPNPTYEEVCSGLTGHTEVVRVVWDRRRTDLPAMLRVFWESHDPTQGMRQGNDVGTQYRSAVYLDGGEAEVAASREAFQKALERAGFGAITTEITGAQPFYYAEDYHQQYLAKNPGGYCGLGGTGVRLSEG